MSKVTTIPDTVEFSIDGIRVVGKAGETIIQVADRYGIYIPRFCYHEQLSVVANCRMCLVEVAKAPKTLTACSTKIASDMQVFTKSEATVTSQRAIMEFLLVNHPLDCPICDKGGECELQDLAMGFGEEVSKFTEKKRSVHDDDIGPLIATDMTRCIHCTRCVRFGTEIAGVEELGLTWRGESMRIQSYLSQSINSELSGNYIDVCPVGALTSKPFRYTGRSWGFTQYHTIAPHDCLGSHMYVHTSSKGYEKKTDIKRVIPATNEAVNSTWLSDRDRFSYLGLKSMRLAQPMLKIHGKWQEVTWERALDVVQLKTRSLLTQYGAKAVGSFISPSATCEEGFLLQKIMRALGVVDIDYRSYIKDDKQAPISPSNVDMHALTGYKRVFILGSYVRHEQPMLGARLRKAVLGGVDAVSINPREYLWNFPLKEDFCVGGQAMVQLLQAVCAEVVKKTKFVLSKKWQACMDKAVHTSESKRLAGYALHNENCWMLGSYLYSHPQASIIRAFVDIIVKATSSYVWHLTPGANSLGLQAVGAIPFSGPQGEIVQQGNGVDAAMQSDKKLLWLHQLEPEFDMYNAKQAMRALEKAEFVVQCTSTVSDTMYAYADVLLPITTHTETRGTLVNTFGHVQTFTPAQTPYANSRPAWKIYRVLGALLQLDDFEFSSIEAVRDAMGPITFPTQADRLTAPDTIQIKPNTMLERVGEVPLYREDVITRRADALQATIASDVACARIHPITAKNMSIHEGECTFAMGDCRFSCHVLIDSSIALGVVWLPSALAETCDYGDRHGDLKFIRAGN